MSALARLLFLVTIALGPTTLRAEEPLRLITQREADLPTNDGLGPSRNLTRGPGVEAVSPPEMDLDGPFRFAVRFRPRNGVPIDPATVRVTYLRQPSIDLTPRVKGFTGPEGIEAPLVTVPAGRHVIEIEVKDRQGRAGRGRITLNAGKVQ
ncbi:hypothetical protein [Aureimonas jatrophae]|uniref:Uncharacterized protein n=1 Tax=Aureimonas jatrophae TaxID=1166073 RepID=A0A1H0M4J0_9HYPH|nr:hypothetical protein [Aureimonas jatrophae]MBB3952628.1 hypothetical protein [Aureimonas jatrophae]SDO75297.1 hypothetical protein SAMN05192530_11264 [Aureimonas jatrophae]